MRIIAGKYRNTKIEIPNLEITRPSTDRVRENIFNIINTKISGACVLDVFSGSGAFAFESVSRGAAKVRANDSNRKCYQSIVEMKDKLGANNLDVSCVNHRDFLRRCASTKWDIVFLDPPYSEKNLYSESLMVLMQTNCLNENSLVVCEHSSKDSIEIPKGYAVYKQKKYGNSKVTILSLI